jgi:hypothetical protein
LVTTGTLVVRGRGGEFRAIDIAAMALAVMIGIYDIMLGVEALNRPKGTIDSVPAPMMFQFGAVALVAALLPLLLVSTVLYSCR